MPRPGPRGQSGHPWLPAQEAPLSPLSGHQVPLIICVLADLRRRRAGRGVFASRLLASRALSFRTPGRKPCSFPPFSFRSANPEMQGGLAWWKGCGFGDRAVPIQALSRGTGQVTRGFSFLLCKMGMMCPRHRIAVRINGNELEVPGLAPGPRGWLRWTPAESGSAGVRRGPCSSRSLLNLEM